MGCLESSSAETNNSYVSPADQINLFKNNEPKGVLWQHRNIKYIETNAYDTPSAKRELDCHFASNSNDIIISTFSSYYLKLWKYGNNKLVNIDEQQYNCYHSMSLSPSIKHFIIDNIIYETKQNSLQIGKVLDLNNCNMHFSKFINDKYIIVCTSTKVVTKDSTQLTKQISVFNVDSFETAADSKSVCKSVCDLYIKDGKHIDSEYHNISICIIRAGFYQVAICYRTPEIRVYSIHLNEYDNDYRIVLSQTINVTRFNICEMATNTGDDIIDCVCFSPNGKLLSLLSRDSNYYVYFKNSKNEWMWLFFDNLTSIGSSIYHQLVWMDNHTMALSCGYSFHNLHFIWIRDGNSKNTIRLLYKYGSIPTDLAQLILSYVAEWKIDKYQINTKWAKGLRVVSLATCHKNKLRNKDYDSDEDEDKVVKKNGNLIISDWSGKLSVISLDVVI